MYKSDKNMVDHEFPWITSNMETRDMFCNICKIHGSTNDWLTFLKEHCECDNIWDYPRVLPDDSVLFHRREK